MPWLMIVLSSATTGRPVATASATSSVRLRSIHGHPRAQVRDDGVRAGHGERRRLVAVRRRVSQRGSLEQPVAERRQHRVACAGDVDRRHRRRGQRDLAVGRAEQGAGRAAAHPHHLDPARVQVCDRAERGELVLVGSDREDGPFPAQQWGDPRSPWPRSPGRRPPGRRVRGPRRRWSPARCRPPPPARRIGAGRGRAPRVRRRRWPPCPRRRPPAPRRRRAPRRSARSGLPAALAPRRPRPPRSARSASPRPGRTR